MAEAVATLGVDATDATRGAQEFARAAEIIFNSDKRMKGQVEKAAKAAGVDPASKKGEGGKKSAEGIADVARELGRVKDASGAVDLAISRIGTTVKGVGAAALLASVAKGIFDATGELNDFEKKIRQISNGNRGSTGNWGMEDLQRNLENIKDLRAENQKDIEGDSRDWVKATASTLQFAFGNLGKFITTGKSGDWEDVFGTREKREDTLRSAEEEALKRVAEKQAEIWAIQQKRLRGDEEGAEIDAIRVEYAEKLQKAINPNGTANLGLQKQLKEEAAVLTSFAERRQKAASFDRLTQRANAANRAGNADRALGMSAEDEQRQSNDTRAAEASAAIDVARKNLEVSPESPKLQDAVSIADRAHQQVLAENLKWERDIARSKGDQVKSTEAQIVAEKLRSQGREAEAEQLESRVQAEIAIAQALRAGNGDLKERLTLQQALNVRVSDYRKMIDPNTGKLRPASERQRDRRKERTHRRNIGRSQHRIDDSEGLDEVQRDSSGKVISGIDPDTGKRVTPEERRKRTQAQIPKAPKDLISADRYVYLKEQMSKSPDALRPEDVRAVQQYEQYFTSQGSAPPAQSQAAAGPQASAQGAQGPAVMGVGILDRSEDRRGERRTMKGMPSSGAMDARITLDTSQLDAFGSAAKFLPQTSANNSEAARQDAEHAAAQMQAQGEQAQNRLQSDGANVATADNTKTAAAAATKSASGDGAAGLLMDIKALLQQWSQ